MIRFEIKAKAIDEDGNEEEVVLTMCSTYCSYSRDATGKATNVSGGFDEFEFDFAPTNPELCRRK